MKEVPYFPLYAANILASKPFRLMNLEQRGLWITIQMECWVNGSVPANINELSMYLGVSLEEIKRTLTQIQYSFLNQNEGELISPELEAYRKAYLERREKQRLGGIHGANQKKVKNNEEKLSHQGEPIAIPMGSPSGCLNHINSNPINLDSINSNQLSKKDVKDLTNSEWVHNYEKSF
jgi:hypothetical protein